MAHVETNLSRKIRVRELAQLLDLSTSDFTRTFKRTLGASPRTYVLRRRIEVAQGLMLTSPEPLSSVALACGMYDQAHFTRCFQRIAGETPHAWRRARLAALDIDQLSFIAVQGAGAQRPVALPGSPDCPSLSGQSSRLGGSRHRRAARRIRAW